MILKTYPPPISPKERRHILSLKPALDALYRGYDYRARVGRDPVSLVHPFKRAEDQEIAGLFAASLAYGRADLFRPKLIQLFDIMATRGGPRAFCDRPSFDAIAGDIGELGYRVTRPHHIASLAWGVGAYLREFGSLAAAFQAGLGAEDVDIGEALARFVEGIYRRLEEELGGQLERGFKHLFPSPRGGSACKRLNLYLRWMIRHQEGVDLGIWPVPPKLLILPMDTHVARMALNLGLTSRKAMSWRTSWEVTRALRLLDPEDPIKYDFALCHMGMSGDCPARRQDAICNDCGLQGLCRWW